MPAIIGGSPSTGSSLLVNILNRHSDIAAGPETHFFTLPGLYIDWKKVRIALASRNHSQTLNNRLSTFGKGYKSPGLHRYNGLKLSLVKDLDSSKLNSCQSYNEFANSCFKQSGKSYWIEKTPANSYCFDHFLKRVNDSKVILMIRNPYDTVASLHARGISIPKACGLYLTNTLANIHLRTSEDYVVVKYESLVNDTKETLTNLCNFLNVPFEGTMLKAESAVIKMDGWKQNEKGEIGKDSINRFDELALDKQDEIISALCQIRLVSKSWPFEEVQMNSISDICELLGYSYIDEREKYSFSLLREKLISTVKLYPTNLFNYPVTFR